MKIREILLLGLVVVIASAGLAFAKADADSNAQFVRLTGAGASFPGSTLQQMV